MTDTPVVTEKMAKAFFDQWDEEKRLRALTNTELVAECLKLDAADYLVVEEMMTRLDPDWAKEKNEE